MGVKFTAQTMKFSIKDFFSKCNHTEEILNGKPHFLCSGSKGSNNTNENYYVLRTNSLRSQRRVLSRGVFTTLSNI